MFNKDFYPTPRHVAEQMLFGLDLKGKTVLEPSAGKGDLVEVLKEYGANVIVCEKNEDLAKIVQTKADRFIKNDFIEVTEDEVSHIDYIIMNPPFSADERHIVHAWDIAPEGCAVISLCNSETVRKGYRYDRLSSLLKDYGGSEELGECFTTAERKTNVEVNLVKLYKPLLSENADFTGFFMEEEEETQGEGIMTYNEIRAIVNRYVGAVKSWKQVFSKMKIEKYVTRGVMNDINSFVQKQTNVPFTMKNVYHMIDVIVGTRQNSLRRALVEAITHYTKYTHENRHGVEGWKTNEGHLLGKKFIIDYIVELPWTYRGKMNLRWSSGGDRLEDLVKVLCNVTGNNYDNITRLGDFFRNFDGLETNKWYSWGFFDIKVFKKGTMHVKFQNVEDWEALNRAYAEALGQKLPEKL